MVEDGGIGDGGGVEVEQIWHNLVKQIWHNRLNRSGITG